MSLKNIDPVPPDAVIFDMDGVLADTRDFHLQAFQELGAPHGVPMTAAQFQTMFGLENSKFLPIMFGREMGPDEIKEMADWKEARYRELIADRLTLLPGARELIHWFTTRGIPISVASSAPRANIEQILQSAGVAEAFTATLSCEDVTRHKPEPDVFLLAAERMQASPDRCWVIEDSLHGIEAAKAARCQALAVATTHPAADLGPADAVFADLSALFRALSRWVARSEASGQSVA